MSSFEDSGLRRESPPPTPEIKQVPLPQLEKGNQVDTDYGASLQLFLNDPAFEKKNARSLLVQVQAGIDPKSTSDVLEAKVGKPAQLAGQIGKLEQQLEKMAPDDPERKTIEDKLREQRDAFNAVMSKRDGENNPDEKQTAARMKIPDITSPAVLQEFSRDLLGMVRAGTLSKEQYHALQKGALYNAFNNGLSNGPELIMAAETAAGPDVLDKLYKAEKSDTPVLMEIPPLQGGDDVWLFARRAVIALRQGDLTPQQYEIIRGKVFRETAAGNISGSTASSLFAQAELAGGVMDTLYGGKPKLTTHADALPTAHPVEDKSTQPTVTQEKHPTVNASRIEVKAQGAEAYLNSMGFPSDRAVTDALKKYNKLQDFLTGDPGLLFGEGMEGILGELVVNRDGDLVPPTFKKPEAVGKVLLDYVSTEAAISALYTSSPSIESLPPEAFRIEDGIVSQIDSEGLILSTPGARSEQTQTRLYRIPGQHRDAQGNTIKLHEQRLLVVQDFFINPQNGDRIRRYGVSTLSDIREALPELQTIK